MDCLDSGKYESHTRSFWLHLKAFRKEMKESLKGRVRLIRSINLLFSSTPNAEFLLVLPNQDWLSAGVAIRSLMY